MQVTTRYCFSLMLAGGIAAGLTSCADRAVEGGPRLRECWDERDCNPDLDCGELVQCVNFICQVDGERLQVPCPFDECRREDECVVVEPVNCCHGCPRVMSRDEVAAAPCFYEQGFPPDVVPDECMIDCPACALCFPQPVGARCQQGRCEARQEGCVPPEGPLDPEPPLLTLAELDGTLGSELGASAIVRLRGVLLPGLADCDDFCTPGQRCCDFAMLLDGVVRLRGNPCDLQLLFWTDDPCADDLQSEGPLAGGAYEIAGTVFRTSGIAEPYALDASAITLIDPPAVGGVYAVSVTAVIPDAADPTCTPPAFTEGETGRVYVAAIPGLGLRAAAPLLDCHYDFFGSLDHEQVMQAETLTGCDQCEHRLEGQFAGDQLYAAYTSWDGQCGLELQFSGER